MLFFFFKKKKITTHIQTDKQERRCTTTEEFGKSCSWVSLPESEAEFYVAGVESITVI